MAVLYVIGCVIILVLNPAGLVTAIQQIFVFLKNAFNTDVLLSFFNVQLDNVVNFSQYANA